MENNTPVPSHHSSERAFEQIHKANQWMRIMVVLALIVFGVMLGFALITLNRVQTQYQDGAIERARVNRELLEALTKSNHDTQVLICSIVTAAAQKPEVTAEIIRICGPILADPKKTQSFLTPGSTKAAAQSSQPAPGPQKLTSQNSQPGPTAPAADPNTNPEQPGLVDGLQQLNPLLCTSQQILLNRCIVKL